jgi:hypothetical protein
MEFFIAWVIPLTLLYHISRTLRLIVEHTWPEEHYLEKRDLDLIFTATIAVFLGEQCPQKNDSFVKNVMSYTKWTIKMLTVHLFPRVFILVGDTPCHDYHHRHPSSKNWTNYIYARQQDLQNINRLSYQEIWGFFKALDINLEAMSKTRKLYA